MVTVKIGNWTVDVLRTGGVIAVSVFVGVTASPFAGALIMLCVASFAFVSLWPRWFHENAFLVALIIYFGVWGGVSVSGADAARPFYEASAQIIPVLFLAMAVSSRLLSLTGRVEIERRVRIVLIYAFVVGEWYSLDALTSSGQPKHGAFAPVVAALAAAGAVVIAEVIGREDPGESGAKGTESPDG